MAAYVEGVFVRSLREGDTRRDADEDTRCGHASRTLALALYIFLEHDCHKEGMILSCHAHWCVYNYRLQ